MDKLITYDELKTIYGIPFSRRHLDRLEAKGRFPKKVLIGMHKARWVNIEIRKHITGLIEARDAGAACKAERVKRRA